VFASDHPGKQGDIALSMFVVNLERRTIDLTKTKNGSARTVHLNSDAVGAIESHKVPGLDCALLKGPKLPSSSGADLYHQAEAASPSLLLPGIELSHLSHFELHPEK